MENQDFNLIELENNKFEVPLFIRKVNGELEKRGILIFKAKLWKGIRIYLNGQAVWNDRGKANWSALGYIDLRDNEYHPPAGNLSSDIQRSLRTMTQKIIEAVKANE